MDFLAIFPWGIIDRRNIWGPSICTFCMFGLLEQVHVVSQRLSRPIYIDGALRILSLMFPTPRDGLAVRCFGKAVSFVVFACLPFICPTWAITGGSFALSTVIAPLQLATQFQSSLMVCVQSVRYLLCHCDSQKLPGIPTPYLGPLE